MAPDLRVVAFQQDPRGPRRDLQCIESIEKSGITALSQLAAAGNTCKLECCVVQRCVELVRELPSYDSKQSEPEKKQDTRATDGSDDVTTG